MTAVFRDSIGVFVLEDVKEIHYNGKGKWSILFHDDETQETSGELINISENQGLISRKR